ncbi:MAG: hypothetical protein WCF92_02210 [bacterium]
MIKKNLLSNIVILVLLLGNIFLLTQYVSVSKQLKQINSQSSENVSARAQASQVLKEYLDVVLNTQGNTSADNRIKLESDLRQIQDPSITTAWEAYLASKDAKTSQANAVKLIGLLENKMVQ